MITRTIKATNIKCGGCANQITTSLSSIEGVNAIEVDMDNGEVKATVFKEEALDAIKAKLISMGYPEDDPSAIQTAKSYVSCMIGRVKK